jgi:hypothetical protein
MRALRLAAYRSLDFSDGSVPNCLRLAFHDAATCAHVRRPLPRSVHIRGCLPTAASVQRPSGVAGSHSAPRCTYAMQALCVLQLTGCVWSRRYRKSRDKGGRARPPATCSVSMLIRPGPAGHMRVLQRCPPRARITLGRRRANGSVLNEIAAGNYSAHAGLDICRGKVLDIVPRVRADACPELTYADAIAVLGARQSLSLDLSTLTRGLCSAQVHRASRRGAVPRMTS